MASLLQEFTKGLWKEIPPFRLVLGLVTNPGGDQYRQ